MRIERIDVRFFRSFNYDYEKKFRGQVSPPEWEVSNGVWFPFVHVDVEPRMTAIVGANEAGKSQLLTAVKAALTGQPMSRTDFCRYSALYSVKSREMRLPEFGVRLALDTEDDQIGEIPELRDADAFTLYRPGAEQPFLVVKGHRVDLSDASASALQARMPTFHELRTDLAIPNNVSIGALAGEAETPLRDRKRRLELLDLIRASRDITDAATTAKITRLLEQPDDEANEEASRKREDEFNLARQLLVDVSRIDPDAFVELRDAIASGREGQVEAVVGAMNAAIKENLNIQRWWSQDEDFDLKVEAREHEIAFTIQDRTGSKYSFDERSQGLRFFLSYFVQLLAHRIEHGKPDILLLDEPDAYLSSVGQQDLLRVLKNYAQPEDGSRPSQVVYVTHSPFLIDKNAPHLIRVLDKGTEDEGTRVVRDAANNRYEPLRSSLGSYVAETAFIGGANLFVEGPVDQLLITGLSNHLSRFSPEVVEVLDLNSVTVVAAGGADGIPYMVYLARGRDSIKPPCVALLDGDKAGREAQRVLRRGEARRRRVLLDDFVVMLDAWATSSELAFDEGVQVREIEDLVPLTLLHRATLNQLSRFQDLLTIDVSAFSVDAVKAQLEAAQGSSWDALEAAFNEAFPEEVLTKVGVAREVVSLINHAPHLAGCDELRERFAALLATLLERLQKATDEEHLNRSDDRFKRTLSNFDSMYPTGISKYDARRLVRELDTKLADGPHTDEARSRLQHLLRTYELNSAAQPEVARFNQFRDEVLALGQLERAAYQDDAESDPAAQILDLPTMPPGRTTKRRNT